MVKALLLNKKAQNQSPAPVKAVEENCVTCGGAHSYRNCPATDGNFYRDNIQEFISQASAVNYNQGNTSYRPPMMSYQILPPGFSLVPNNQNVQINQRNNQNHFIKNQNQGKFFNQGPVYQPPVFQPPAYQALAPQTQGDSKEDFSAYVKANDAFVNSNSASTSSSGTLPRNTIANPRSDLKAITTRSGVSYDGPKIPPPPSFLPKSESPILTSEPVTSPISEPVIALTSLLDLTPTCMTLELADHSISHSVGVAEDVYVEVGSFHFSADFVVVDFDADPRVPLILERLLLKIERALIDVFEGELTLRVGKEAITFNLDQTSRYDFLLEEVDAFFAIKDDPTSPEVYQPYLDPEGDILLLEA
nr:reverse transcriptase domain-containing protein [Tanacetum cinerariifolium]